MGSRQDPDAVLVILKTVISEKKGDPIDTKLIRPGLNRLHVLLDALVIA